MTAVSYRLPDGTIPVLLSADSSAMLRAEADALHSYAVDHPGVEPQAIAGMLFRTRAARKHRALAMVADRDDLLAALRAVGEDHDHPAVVRGTADTRRVGFVFPGQGGQRPGMGRLFYDAAPAFRAEADRCAQAFATEFGESPLNYLLDKDVSADDGAGTVQPALFTQMAALAAMWQSFGIAADAAVGHSQGEIAAAYLSGAVTLADAVRVVGIRAHTADQFGSGDYAMAVLAADRDACEELLAQGPGWAEVSVVNSPNLTGVSGDRAAVQHVVDALTRRGTFARVIRVRYPAHTSLIDRLGDNLRTALRRELQNPKFLDADLDCVGATLGGPIAQDLPVDEYWFRNLRDTVRFDEAVAAALRLGVDTFVELAEHPTLQLAIDENLSVWDSDENGCTRLVFGTSDRAATDLGVLTRNLAALAVHDLDYPWHRLGTESDGPTPLPLLDFPNTQLNEKRLCLPCHPSPCVPASRTKPAAVEKKPAPTPSRPRLLAEEWVRLSHRSLMSPRSLGIIDHTGECAELAAALCAGAAGVGATARLIDPGSPSVATGLDTYLILVPSSGATTAGPAVAEVAAFFGDRTWWPGATEGVGDSWLVTTGAEAVVSDDDAPGLVHAAVSAGFRCVGAEHPGTRFRHLDLPAGSPANAAAILSAVHTDDESELALRDSGLYAKRVVEHEAPEAMSADVDADVPDHVLIIGGTGNVGLEFCEHFARRGARRITLVSRSGETAEVAERLRRFGSSPAQIRVARCNVGDDAAVSLLAEQHQDTPADLIIHAAVQYSGAELADITAEHADQALRAKVGGIWRILQAFPRTEDCRAVFCSSVAATVGGRGLIMYAAANRMLDAMAHRLRSTGLDCVSVQWGQWAVTFDPTAAGTAQLAVTGLLPMSPGDALALGLGRFRENVGVVALDPGRARSVLESCGRGSLLGALDVAEPPTSAPGAAATVATVATVAQRLLAMLAQTIGLDGPDEIDPDTPLVAIGLDSLQALELRRRVQAEFDHELEVSDLLGGASPADLLARLGS